MDISCQPINSTKAPKEMQTLKPNGPYAYFIHYWTHSVGIIIRLSKASAIWTLEYEHRLLEQNILSEIIHGVQTYMNSLPSKCKQKIVMIINIREKIPGSRLNPD